MAKKCAMIGGRILRMERLWAMVNGKANKRRDGVKKMALRPPWQSKVPRLAELQARERAKAWRRLRKGIKPSKAHWKKMGLRKEEAGPRRRADRGGKNSSL